MSGWKQISAKDINAFLNDKGVKQVGPHNLSRKILHWPYCSRCGLIALKNDASKRALRKSCVVYV